jgi:hypothetical protein
MRRLVAALVLAALVMSLSAATPAPAADPAAAPAAPAAAPAAAAAADTHMPTETVTNEPFPATADSTPQRVMTLLQNKQPMMLFFYDSTQSITKDQRTEIDTVLKKYRGLIDLLAYDIGSGLPDSATAKDPEVQRAMDMAGQLKVNFTPYIVFVDRAGRVTYRFSTFTDRQLLEREILRATQ